MRRSVGYTLGFAFAVCAVCSVVVSASAVLLADRQADNERHARQLSVLRIVGLASDDATREQVAQRFEQQVRIEAVETAQGRRQVFVTDEAIVLEVEGQGLWSTMYGYLALESDTTTIRGLSFYQHGETPGLGGEIDNPRWLARWVGRRVFDDGGAIRIAVVKGAAPPATKAPFEVDGISGATITSRGVTDMLQFWLGPSGYGPYLEKR